MATLAADMSFDFTFPSYEPVTPPSFSFDPSLLEIPYNPGHARSSSYGSIISTTETSPSDSVSTRVTTPSRSPPPIRQHGPILLPKIRSQDQDINNSPPKRIKTSPAPSSKPKKSQSGVRRSHARSCTNPETLNSFSNSFFTPSEDQSQLSKSLLCSPVIFPSESMERRASTCSLDGSVLDKYGFPTYRQMPSYVPAVTQPQVEPFMYNQYAPRAPSPLSVASTPDPTPCTTLMNYLTTANPAPSLVRSLSFALRDPNTKHFWWDVRQIRSWTSFNAQTILSLPGASALLNCPVPAPLLAQPPASARHPETEAALHGIYSSFYLPKLNSALAMCSQRPLQLSVPSKPASANDHVFVANVMGESASAAAIFGGKPTARVVGLVKSFDRFNTGMRVEGNIKRVEYLRGLAHLHHVMREHGCRYGFILTEIELVVVRNGSDAVPNFGYLEVNSVQLNAVHHNDADNNNGEDDDTAPTPTTLTACLALWGLCMMAGDEAAPGQALWRADIGAPAEGTRRKALPRDDWMPQPQLAEKREAKRARGWILPEDPVGRKELGKRGVRYGSC